MSEQTVLKTDEAMKALGLSRVELWRLRKSGKLGFCKVGRRIRYQQKHIDAFLAAAECVLESGRAVQAKR